MMDKPLVKWVTGLQFLAVYTYKPDCGSNIHHSDLLVLQLYKRLEDSNGYVPYSRVGHNARERPAAGERPLRTGHWGTHLKQHSIDIELTAKSL